MQFSANSSHIFSRKSSCLSWLRIVSSRCDSLASVVTFQCHAISSRLQSSCNSRYLARVSTRRRRYCHPHGRTQVRCFSVHDHILCAFKILSPAVSYAPSGNCGGCDAICLTLHFRRDEISFSPCCTASSYVIVTSAIWQADQFLSVPLAADPFIQNRKHVPCTCIPA